MSTAQPFGDHYYSHQYSPPVSPKSLPHGYKRKASTQEDELETNNLISHSFKKLRLNTARKLSTPDIAPVGVSYRDATPSDASINHHIDQASRHDSLTAGPSHDGDDYMPLDDTADRIWVHDLDAEIAAIEAEEAEQAQQNDGIQLSEAGKEYSKIPEHLLKQSASVPDRAANMQMILYRDPISISVPEEDDAVRKTIIEARRRMREKQAEEREALQSAVLHHAPEPSYVNHGYDNGDLDEDDMDLD